MAKLQNAEWSELQALRDAITKSLTGASNVGDASQRFVIELQRAFPSIVLARLFVVAPLAALPEAEQNWSTDFAASVGRPTPLAPTTPVLCLCGTVGAEAAWCDRTRSKGHRAIPFVDRELVQGAPMLAQLLASLNIELAVAPRAPSIELRQVSGSLYKSFYVADARDAQDASGRRIIPSTEFVEKHQVRTVFGMGGSYVNGMIAIAIVFTGEELTTVDVSRMPSFIGTFKIATADLVASGKLL